MRRQVPTEIKQGCTTTGYEKRVRELCEEVLETKCKVSPMQIIYLLSILSTLCSLLVFNQISPCCILSVAMVAHIFLRMSD